MIISAHLKYEPELSLWQLVLLRSGRTYLAPTRGEVISRCMTNLPAGKTIRIST